MEDYTYEQIHHHSETGMKYEIYDTDGFFNSKHWHNELEILYIISGSMVLNVDGKDYSISTGGFIIINPRSIHSVICQEKTRHMLIQIPYEMLRKNVPDIEITTFSCYCPKIDNCVAENIGIKSDLDKLKKHYELPRNEGYYLKFNSYIFELLYKLVTSFKSVADPVARKKTDRNIERLGVVIQYVRQHYPENITLNDAAVTIDLNREYFARFFRKYMGMTFMDYVFAVRLEHVYHDIMTTDYTVGAIADRNGFCHNYKLFVRKFKEQYGCSPGEARKLLGKKKD